MKEMLYEMILDSIDPSELKRAIGRYVEFQVKDLDLDDIAEGLCEEFDFLELAVEAAAELLLPF